MKALGVIGLGCIACARVAFGGDDFLDRVDDALTMTACHEVVRARFSGTLDLEGYDFQRPASGLIYAEKNDLLNPRLSLFLDAQLGPRLYLFAQARLDRGFDPSDAGGQSRLDEYALRFTPWDDGRVNFQIGKFATVVGDWVSRHYSWDNPFITAPLPYENLTGIFDGAAARSTAALLRWARVPPQPSTGNAYADAFLRVPIIWGPSYTSGAAIAGTLGRVDYAVEWKNASLSSRPEAWDAAQTRWQHPTFSGRLGFRPDERWNFGFSASTGSYLRPSAQPTLAPGHSLDDYREVVLGQDLSFAWHHVQLWAECYEARFAIPLVGDVETLAYYVEAKYKFTPQFSGALRWNQQQFGHVRAGNGALVPWGNEVWRIDVAPSYRFTAHTECKLQYSLQHNAVGPQVYTHLYAVQLVIRF
jgi:hypothetical protein